MNLFGKRPLALFCASFAVAAVLGCYMTIKRVGLHLWFALLLFLVSALLLAVPFLLHRFHPRLLSPCLALAFAALALLQSWFCIGEKLQTVSALEGQKADCVIHIKEETLTKSYLSSYRAEVTHINGHTFSATAKVSLPFLPSWQMGDVIRGSFLVYAVNNGTENAAYQLSDGILLELEAEEESFFLMEHRKPSWLSTTFSALREKLSARICSLVEDEEGHLTASLFLNRRDLLSNDTSLNFRRAGATHLLSISGLHLSVIIFLLESLLRFIGLHKKGRCAAILLTAFFYLMLTGFALSTCRAFLMCCFVYLSWIFQSDNDSVTALFFSLFFILLLSPLSVYDIGMWMSVSAVLGILVVTELLKIFRTYLKQKKIGNRTRKVLFSVMSSVCVSLAAQIFILLPMWLAFDELSLMALPAALLMSPLVSLVLLITPFLLLLSRITIVGILLGRLLFFICRTLLWTAELLSSFRGITVSLARPFFSYFIPIVTVALALLLIIKLKRTWLVYVAMSASVLTLSVFLCVIRLPTADSLTGDFLKQSQNELLILSVGEESVICDMTSGSYTAIRQTQSLLSRRYTTEIAAYLLTHYHAAHESSLSRLFSSIMVRSLCLPLPQTAKESEICVSLISMAREKDVTVFLYDRETPLFFGPLSLTVSGEAYLDRSAKPVFYLTVSAFGKTAIYSSSSVHEDQNLYASLCEKTADADLLLLGTHGPAMKSNFSYPTGNGRVFLSDESLLPFFKPQNSKTPTVSNATEISFLWKAE